MLKILEVAAIDATIHIFVLPLMDALRDEGFELVVAAADTGYSEKLRKRGYSVFGIDFVRNLSPAANLKALIQLIKLLCRERPDILHTHTPIASVLSRAAAKISGVPHVVYTLHGLKPQKLFIWIEKFVCRYMTDHIFVVNKVDLKFLTNDCRVPRDKISLLNGVGINTCRFDPKRFDEIQREALKKELGLDDSPVIGFVGRVIREKGIFELVEAFAKIRRKQACKLLIIGSAGLNERDSATIAKIKRIISSKRLEASVIFTGHRDDIPSLLSVMNIFVLPSYIEGMCVSTLEAMSMELPVVATDIRGIREEVTPDCGILVTPRNIAELAHAIEDILLMEEYGKQMGVNGRKRVIRLFSERKALDAQIKLFNRIKEHST